MQLGAHKGALSDADCASLQTDFRAEFPKGIPQRIAIAVSGGGDSMALLHLAYEAARDHQTEIFALTVDHGLRAESADEAQMVAGFAKALGVPHVTLQWQREGTAGNLSAQARTGRYAAIAAWCRQNDVGHVLLGHTRDDQAENFIMRLARRSGPDGLAMMPQRFERDGVAWQRPLLAMRRETLRAYLHHHNIAWIEDPTNEDARYERARVRKAMDVLDGLGIDQDALLDVSQAMSHTREALAQVSNSYMAARVSLDRGDLIFRTEGGDDIPRDILRRIWSRMLQRMGGHAYPPRAGKLDTLLDASQDMPRTLTLAGCQITREVGNWRISREYQAVRDQTCATKDVWDDKWVLSGPHDSELQIKALGPIGLRVCADWRETGLPRASLLASPAVWQRDTLIAAPLADKTAEWTAKIKADFHHSLLMH
jgi:tRNA(Ile)-lysidine synthase